MLPATLPIPIPEAHVMLEALFAAVRRTLGERLIAFYLDGSLTTGAFDEDSDIDFVAVLDGEISQELFQTLYAMHDRLAATDSSWAVQIEGSYLSRQAVRRYDPAFTRYPNIERGQGERLKWAVHDQGWDVHRSVLCERGITLLGPEPRSLIDPVTPAQLTQAMDTALSGWAQSLLANPAQIASRGYQSYIVLTVCRILYTLENGAVTSKPAALDWAKTRLGARWTGLLERAWTGRHESGGPIVGDDLAETMQLIRLVLAAKPHHGAGED